MTAYFDNIGTELNALKLKHSGAGYVGEYAEALDAIEHRLVADVSICTMCPGFPADLIEPIDKMILELGIATLPHGMEMPPRNDFEDIAQHSRAVGRLASELHSAFHAVGSRGIPGFTDNPTAAVRVLLLGAAQDRQEALARALNIGTFRPADAEERPLDVAPSATATPAAPASGEPAHDTGWDQANHLAMLSFGFFGWPEQIHVPLRQGYDTILWRRAGHCPLVVGDLGVPSEESTPFAVRWDGVIRPAMRISWDKELGRPVLVRIAGLNSTFPHVRGHGMFRDRTPFFLGDIIDLGKGGTITMVGIVATSMPNAAGAWLDADDPRPWKAPDACKGKEPAGDRT